jgi:tetratricopeptide (TPR) repeat protein
MALGPAARGQETRNEWQSEARRYAEAQQWERAMEVVGRVLDRAPQDLEAKAWRARLLLWSGRAAEAEREFRELTRAEPRDPDLFAGLASALERQGHSEESLAALERAVEIDPARADLRTARGRALRRLGRTDEARREFREALRRDPGDAEARAGLLSLRGDPKHELRLGSDTDLFNYSDAYFGEWVSLVSRWTQHWGTAVAGSFYQRAGTCADRFMGSTTARWARWGALTAGGAAARDNGIVPKSEALFEYDRGWRVSERRFVRGVELAYGQHWYWYRAARILTLNGAATVYLPREWSWSLGLTAARSRFSGTPAEWRPSGATRLSFPVVKRGQRRLSGNVFFAVGTENFARLDQVGRFSAHTYGGGFKFQFTAKQDLTAYAAYQKRTQNRTQTSFGISYGIHF